MDASIIIVWISFIFCLGLSAGGILVFFKNRAFRQFPAFRFLQYAIILWYTFGFYSLWSKTFFRLFFNERQIEELAMLSDFIAIIGTPFLLAGMILFCLWSYNLLQTTPSTFVLISVFLLPLSLMVVLVIAFEGTEIIANVYQLYAVLAMAFVTGNFMLLAVSELNCISRHVKYILLLILLSIGLIHMPFLFSTSWSQIYEVYFIFLFFLTITGLEVFFLYSVKWTVKSVKPVPIENGLSLDTFILQYGITARELEVIKELYAGKTNKQIAEALFITLQTVKDHNHRIFQKTHVKSRTQLTSLLRCYDQLL